MIDEKKLIGYLEQIANENPYGVPSKPYTYSGYNEGWADCAERMISIAENMPQIDAFGKWVSCSERLPEKPIGGRYSDLILRAWVRHMEEETELLEWCLGEIDRLSAIIAERENDERQRKNRD